MITGSFKGKKTALKLLLFSDYVFIYQPNSKSLINPKKLIKGVLEKNSIK